MYVRRQTLGAAFLTKGGGGGKADRGGMFAARSVNEGEAQKFSYPNNQCPRGYRQVGSGSDGPPSGYSPPWGDYVLCRPTPTAAPAPQQAPNIQTQVTVSPAIQTDVSPQISPAFFQAQDSPGASQAATAVQTKEGQQADTGGTGTGNGAAQMIELIRAQAEADRQRRQEEAAIRERERQTQRQRQLEEEQRRRAEEQQRQQAEKAERDQQAAELQAQYQAELEASRSAAVEPGVTFVPMPGGGGGAPQPLPSAPQSGAPAEAQAGAGLPLPLIVGAVVIGGAVLYVVMRQRGKKR